MVHNWADVIEFTLGDLETSGLHRVYFDVENGTFSSIGQDMGFKISTLVIQIFAVNKSVKSISYKLVFQLIRRVVGFG